MGVGKGRWGCRLEQDDGVGTSRGQRGRHRDMRLRGMQPLTLRLRINLEHVEHCPGMHKWDISMSTSGGSMCAVGYSRSPWDVHSFQPPRGRANLRGNVPKQNPPSEASHNTCQPHPLLRDGPPWAYTKSLNLSSQTFPNRVKR